MTDLPKPDVTVTVVGTDAGGLHEILSCRIFENQSRFLWYSFRGETLCLHRDVGLALALPFPLEPGEQLSTFLVAWLMTAKMPEYDEGGDVEMARFAVPGWRLVWSSENIEISRVWVSKK